MIHFITYKEPKKGQLDGDKTGKGGIKINGLGEVGRAACV